MFVQYIKNMYAPPDVTTSTQISHTSPGLLDCLCLQHLKCTSTSFHCLDKLFLGGRFRGASCCIVLGSRLGIRQHLAMPTVSGSPSWLNKKKKDSDFQVSCSAFISDLFYSFLRYSDSPHDSHLQLEVVV